jgi:transposase
MSDYYRLGWAPIVEEVEIECPKCGETNERIEETEYGFTWIDKDECDYCEFDLHADPPLVD